MPSPCVDVSDSISTTSLTFPNTPNYQYTNASDRFLMIEELSFAVDGNFNNQGRALIKIRGQVITQQGGAQSSGGIPLLANLTFNFKKDSVLVILGPGETVEVAMRSADGSTAVKGQISLTGYYLSRTEAKILIERTEAQGGLVFAGMVV